MPAPKAGRALGKTGVLELCCKALPSAKAQNPESSTAKREKAKQKHARVSATQHEQGALNNGPVKRTLVTGNILPLNCLSNKQ